MSEGKETRITDLLNQPYPARYVAAMWTPAAWIANPHHGAVARVAPLRATRPSCLRHATRGAKQRGYIGRSTATVADICWGRARALAHHQLVSTPQITRQRCLHNTPRPRADTCHFANKPAPRTGLELAPLWAAPCNHPRTPVGQDVVLARCVIPTSYPERYPWRTHVRLRSGPRPLLCGLAIGGTTQGQAARLPWHNCSSSCGTHGLTAQRLPHASPTVRPNVIPT